MIQLDPSRFSHGGQPPFSLYVKEGVIQPGEFVLLDHAYYDDRIKGRIWLLRGFITNFGSTPQLMRASSTFDPLQHCIWGALPHDLVFCMGFMPLSDANDLFQRAALASGESSLTVKLWYNGLRIGSRFPWRSYRARGDGPQVEDFDSPDSYTLGLEYFNAFSAGREWSPPTA